MMNYNLLLFSDKYLIKYSNAQLYILVSLKELKGIKHTNTNSSQKVIYKMGYKRYSINVTYINLFYVMKHNKFCCHSSTSIKK